MGKVGNLMNLELRMQSAFVYAMGDKNLEFAGEKARLCFTTPGSSRSAMLFYEHPPSPRLRRDKNVQELTKTYKNHKETFKNYVETYKNYMGTVKNFGKFLTCGS
jgi:hypothetical protein